MNNIALENMSDVEYDSHLLSEQLLELQVKHVFLLKQIAELQQQFNLQNKTNQVIETTIVAANVQPLLEMPKTKVVRGNKYQIYKQNGNLVHTFPCLIECTRNNTYFEGASRNMIQNAVDTLRQVKNVTPLFDPS